MVLPSVLSRRSRPCSASVRYSIFKSIYNSSQHSYGKLCTSNASNLLCLSSWWTCSGDLACQWAPTTTSLSTSRMYVSCWRSLSPRDRSVRGPLKWAFLSSRSGLVYWCECYSIFIVQLWTVSGSFFYLAEFTQAVQGDGSSNGHCIVAGKSILQIFPNQWNNELVLVSQLS